MGMVGLRTTFSEAMGNHYRFKKDQLLWLKNANNKKKDKNFLDHVILTSSRFFATLLLGNWYISKIWSLICKNIATTTAVKQFKVWKIIILVKTKISIR